jgi:hypothetical protein
MAARSLTATPDGIDDINRALTEKKWSREDLAKACDCSRQPAVKFCSGKAVSKKLFVSFCEALSAGLGRNRWPQNCRTHPQFG